MPPPKPTPPKPATTPTISKTDYGLSLTPTPLDIRKHKVDLEQVKKVLFNENALKKMKPRY